MPHRLRKVRSFYIRKHKIKSFKVAFHLSVMASRKELVLASLNGTVQGIFPATTHQFPALWPTGARELNSSDSRAGPLWPETFLRTRAFYLKTDSSDWRDRRNGQRSKSLSSVFVRSLASYICLGQQPLDIRNISCCCLVLTTFYPLYGIFRVIGGLMVNIKKNPDVSIWTIHHSVLD